MREGTLKYHCEMNSADCAMDKAHRRRGEKPKTSLKLPCGRLTHSPSTLELKFWLAMKTEQTEQYRGLFRDMLWLVNVRGFVSSLGGTWH